MRVPSGSQLSTVWPLRRAWWPVAVVLAGAALGYLTIRQPLIAPAVIALAGLMVLVATAWRRPDFALLGLTAMIPFSGPLLAKLYVSGAPAAAVGLARFWTELVVGILVVKLVLQSDRQLSSVDWLAMAFIGLVGVYVLLQTDSGYTGRLVGARQDAGYLAVFLVARHLKLPENVTKRVELVLLCTGSILAALAFWNHFWPDSWAQWIGSIGLVRYRTEVLLAPSSPPIVTGTLAGHSFIRAGSLALDPLSLPYYLIIPIGIAIGAVVAGRVRIWHIIAGPLCAAGLLLSLTRSAIATLPIMLGLGLVAGRKRVRLAVALMLGGAALWPLASGLALGDHLRTALDPTDPSTGGHLFWLRASVDLLVQNPLGTGVGSVASTAQRFAPFIIVNHSWYFQVGSEVGVLGMILYLSILVLVLAGLWSRSRHGSQHAVAALCALTAIALGGLVLETLDDIQLAWAIWLLVGLALRTQTAHADPSAAAERASIQPVRLNQP